MGVDVTAYGGIGFQIGENEFNELLKTISFGGDRDDIDEVSTDLPNNINIVKCGDSCYGGSRRLWVVITSLFLNGVDNIQDTFDRFRDDVDLLGLGNKKVTEFSDQEWW